MTKKKVPQVWCALIPDIFGYGIQVFATSEYEAMQLLRKGYTQMRDSHCSSTPFLDAFVNWGGRCERVEFGKFYYDNLGE